MRAVVYLRVSTAAQGRSGLGLDAQRSAVVALAASRDLKIAAEFVEVESGKNSDRCELAKALQLARMTGAILVIAKLDRLSRNAAFLLTLRDSGVRFMAADMPDANNLTIGILAVMAQAEREAISKRTTEALAVVKDRLQSTGEYVSRAGRRITRLGNPNGSAHISKGLGNRHAVIAVQALAEARASDLGPLIKELQAGGATSFRSIAAALNRRGVLTPRRGQWHASTVRGVVARLAHQRGVSLRPIPPARSCALDGGGEPKSSASGGKSIPINDLPSY